MTLKSLISDAGPRTNRPLGVTIRCQSHGAKEVTMAARISAGTH